MMITVVPVGKIDEEYLDVAAEALRGNIPNALVDIHNDILPIPGDAHSSTRDQYRSSTILRDLYRWRTRSRYLLGVTEVDLYTGDMNFIFGQAIPRRGVAIISVHRLKYGLRYKTSDQQIFHERISKEAVHEVGHLIGLSHCDNPECVMHFSNTLSDTDRKKTSFCKKCHRTIR